MSPVRSVAEAEWVSAEISWQMEGRRMGRDGYPAGSRGDVLAYARQDSVIGNESMELASVASDRAPGRLLVVSLFPRPPQALAQPCGQQHRVACDLSQAREILDSSRPGHSRRRLSGCGQLLSTKCNST